MNISSYKLEKIVSLCAQETDNYFHNKDVNPHYCYELLRRALVIRDELAWQAVYEQYSGMVASWVEKCPSFPGSGEEIGYFINAAFTKFWTAVAADRFSQFSTLAALLQYLKLCVYSVVTDFARSKELAKREQSITEPHIKLPPSQQNVERSVTKRSQNAYIWQLIQSRLKNEKEFAAIYGSFILDLKPRQIAEEFSAIFADSKDVSRTKDNILARLRRDTNLLDQLSNA